MNTEESNYVKLTDRTREHESYEDWIKDVKRLAMHYEDDFTEQQNEMLQTLYNCYNTAHDAAMYLINPSK